MELGVSDCWSMCGVGEGFEEGVVEKGVWVGNEASVVHVAVFGAKGDDTRHGVCTSVERPKRRRREWCCFSSAMVEQCWTLFLSF